MGALRLVVNGVRRLADGIYDARFSGGSTKHLHYRDFGYPEQVTFTDLFHAYTRNGLARAAVEKTIGKTWEDNPWLLDHPRDAGDDKGETSLEREIRDKFSDIRLWQHLAEADRRSLVGRYGAVILRLADSKRFYEPVDTVPGGLDGLAEIIPAWEGQLTVSDWDTDETSDTYGQPKMFQFNEANVGEVKQQPRSFNVHPDRVIVWSRDGTVHGRPFLEPGYNALLDMEKIIGAGGEGFWKNAKSAPVIEVDKEFDVGKAAQIAGVESSELLDAMNDQVADYQKGFDQLLMLQGMVAKSLSVTLPSPEHFFGIALQAFAASISIPMKILVGSQTGERASTEDADEWARTIKARRTNETIPNVMSLVNRLERFGILREADWTLDWADLGEPSISDKVGLADKMADVNQKMRDTGEFVFTPEEMRAAVDLEPLTDSAKYRDGEAGDGEAAALPDQSIDDEAEAA